MKKLLSILGAIGLIATTGASVVACSNTSSINYTFENGDSQLRKKDDNVVIILTDYASLTNAKARSDNEAILTVTEPDDKGKITVTATANSGTTTVTLTADGKTDTVISFTISETIDATLDKQSIEVEKSTTITVTNIKDLIGLKVTANPSANVDLSGPNDQGVITVKGNKVGDVKITLTAENAIKAIEFSLTITPQKYDIDAKLDKTEIAVNGKTTITVTNFAQLINLKATAQPAANVGLDLSAINQGIISITGKNVGSTTITVTADNQITKKDFTLVVKAEQVGIKAQSQNPGFTMAETAGLTITNYADLINAKAEISAPDIAIFSESNMGNYTIQPLKVGKFFITVSADNAKSDFLTTYQVFPTSATINATLDKTEIVIGEEATITIANPNDLTNVDVNDNPLNIVSITTTSEKTWVKLVGKNVGSTTITLSSRNAPNKSFTIGVKPQKVAIQVDKLQQRLRALQEVTINIINVDQLLKNSLTAEITNSGGLNLVNLDTSQIKEGKIKVAALSLAGELDVTINAANAIAPVNVHFIITLI